jgi:regulator of replication initiation timing
VKLIPFSTACRNFRRLVVRVISSCFLNQLALSQKANERKDRINEQRNQLHDLRAQVTERDKEIGKLKLDNISLKNRLSVHVAQANTHEGVSKWYRDQLAKFKAENRNLRQDLAAARSMRTVAGVEAQGEDVGNGPDGEHENQDEEEDEDKDGPPDPIYDGLVYMCCECGFEVVDGECQRCWTKHNWDDVSWPVARDSLPLSYTQYYLAGHGQGYYSNA